MRQKILFRYILKEMFLPFLVSLVVFTGILFLFKVLKLVELLVSKSAPISEVLLLFSYVIPRFLEIALPMSTLLGVIIAFGRLSSDSEIVVVRASGMSLGQLVLPVLCFSSFVMLMTALMTFFVTPLANHKLGTGIFEMAKVQARSSLLPGVFNEFGQLMVYAENIQNEGTLLENILISDNLNQDRPKRSIARSGLLVSDESNRRLSLRLYQGSVFEGAGNSFNITRFDVENVNISSDELSSDEQTRDGKTSSELSMKELRTSLLDLRANSNFLGSEDLKQLSRYEVEWHRRIVLPFACIAVALVAMCLGIQPSRGGQSLGMSATVVIGIFGIVLYYLGLAMASALGKQAIAPAWFVMWVPNIIFFGSAFYLLKQIGSEKWLTVGEAVGNFIEKIGSKLSFSRN